MSCKQFCCCPGCCCIGPPGPPGTPGTPGTPGPPGSAASCGCIQQLRNVMAQLITLYPDKSMNFNMEDGGTTTGKPTSLFPPPNTNENAGIVLIGEEAVSLCKIASIKIPGETYNNAITYLSVPSPAPVGCDANCESAIRTWVAVGDKVKISVGGKDVEGTIKKDEFGMLVVVGNNDLNPQFVPICKIETIKKQND